MGRTRNRGNNGNGGTKRGRTDEWQLDHRAPTTLSNAAFEQYYKASQVVQADEWEAFIGAMRTALPTALRVNMNSPCRDGICQLVTEHLAKVVPATALAFYPSKLGMHSGASRGAIKRNADFKVQKRLIAALSEGGYLTRQEAVSMIPPLALDVQPGDHVLDLCAAPGSKTSQILERLVQAGGGCVVANDVNSSRLDVLNHQTNRIPLAQTHLIITNNDALMYPLAACPEAKFDRVLCDVMCSGDGTLRKSMDLWARWNALQGADLHSSQIRALTRGMMLCKKGGVVVYSTCSLNPLEDESVVQHCLRSAGGAFRLLNVADRVPGLRFSHGRATWTVTSKDLQEEYTTYAEAEASNVRRGGKGFHYRPGMFADTPFLESANIHYTVRVLPHQQDTGGFFIAAFACLDDYPASLASNKKLVIAPTQQVPPPAPVSAELAAIVTTAMALPPDFPMERLLVRGEQLREMKLYYASPAAARRLPLLIAVGCRVDQAGVKVFESYVRHTNNKLRFASDGCSSLVTLLPAAYQLAVTPAELLEVVGGSTASIAAKLQLLRRQQQQDPLKPRPCFIAVCDLGTPLGLLYVPGIDMGGSLVMKVTEWQKTLLSYALGLPIVESTGPGAEEPNDDDDDDGSGASAAGDNDGAAAAAAAAAAAPAGGAAPAEETVSSATKAE